MKRRLWLTACAAALLAFVSITAVAKDHGDKGRGRGRGKDNYGQNKKRYREFNEDQRRYARTYYTQHEQDFRQPEQWNDDDERLIQPGYVLDPEMRRWARPAPYDMIRGLGPPPRGYRYVVLGGHVILVDSGYRVHDAIHFDINIGH
ncbi:MAG: hypothetical protein ACYDA9_07385 [Terriglobia bacterium]